MLYIIGCETSETEFCLIPPLQVTSETDRQSHDYKPKHHTYQAPDVHMTFISWPLFSPKIMVEYWTYGPNTAVEVNKDDSAETQVSVNKDV